MQSTPFADAHVSSLSRTEDPKTDMRNIRSRRNTTRASRIGQVIGIHLVWTKTTGARGGELIHTEILGEDVDLCMSPLGMVKSHSHQPLAPTAYSADRFLRTTDAGKLDTVFGQSYRIGGALALLVAGVAPEVIMQLGGWSSLSFLIYWQHLQLILLPAITRSWDARIREFAEMQTPSRSTIQQITPTYFSRRSSLCSFWGPRGPFTHPRTSLALRAFAPRALVYGFGCSVLRPGPSRFPGGCSRCAPKLAKAGPAKPPTHSHKKDLCVDFWRRHLHKYDDGWTSGQPPHAARSKANPVALVVTYTCWFFVALALASLALQATRTPTITSSQEHVLYVSELAITIAFDVEILLRILASLPDWRAFLGFGAGGVGFGKGGAPKPKKSEGPGPGQNWLDTALAIACSVIQIPAIQRSSVYPWLSIFQLMRFYRVILVVPRMKPLLLAVFGNMYGLINMTLFLILMNFIATLVSVQFLRGDLPSSQTMNFGSVFTAFLAIYQIFSSENWTNVLYATAGAEEIFGQSIISVLFISGWLLFANFIILQMFIAVINENFDVAEEAKKGQQATNYWVEASRPTAAHITWLRKLNPYRWIRASPVEVKVESLPANLVLPMQKSLVTDYNVPKAHSVFEGETSSTGTGGTGKTHFSKKCLTALQKLFGGELKNDIPLTTLRHTRNDTLGGDPQDEETERHLELLAAVRNETTTTNEELSDTMYERRAQKANFIRDHPSYDKTFWIFSQKNILRKFCQKLVQPGLASLSSQPRALYIAGTTFEAWTHAGHVCESAFGLVFFVEFLIKIIADGFLFTPNAYSDCGSTAWAFTLFIAWNLLSMYIFVNMFTGVIVENFSYVFQTSDASKSITRAQMRSFKKVWAEFANPKTGFLERSRFVPFFGKLSGLFEARIYPTEFSVPSIQARCKPSNDSQYAWPGRVVDGRRAVYARLYHEASILHQGRGMSFTDMLFLLAHHKLIVDRDVLVFKDLVVRTETNKLVTDLVNLDYVRSLLKTILHRRRFLKYKQQQLMALEPDIPSIIVDVMPSTPPSTTRDISSAGYTSAPGSPTPGRFFTPDVRSNSHTNWAPGGRADECPLSPDEGPSHAQRDRDEFRRDRGRIPASSCATPAASPPPRQACPLRPPRPARRRVITKTVDESEPLYDKLRGLDEFSRHGHGKFEEDGQDEAVYRLESCTVSRPDVVYTKNSASRAAATIKTTLQSAAPASPLAPSEKSPVASLTPPATSLSKHNHRNPGYPALKPVSGLARHRISAQIQPLQPLYSVLKTIFGLAPPAPSQAWRNRRKLVHAAFKPVSMLASPTTHLF
ncbi:Ion transport protein-domain-containing protein [Mycena galopus ATCC 62051]|nr:Ion transport protein-domain-containing protein [Mycena galopus ATCC 62051]